jgi:predicted phage-related endonuclease
MSNDIRVKATMEMVAKIGQFADLKAEIARLEKLKSALSEEIDSAFGDADILVHRNIDIARRDWRERKGTDEKMLAEKFPEAYEATRKTTRFSVIVNIFRK